MVKVNDCEFGNELFFNGETVYKEVDLNDDLNTIEVEFTDDSDITKIMFAVQYIRDKKTRSKIVLKMLYIPYSRMDREIPEGKQLFSLKYFANIINSMYFDKVVVLDPHSKISVDLIENLWILRVDRFIRAAVDNFKADYLFYPDKGAYSKYPELISREIKLPYFYGTKKRDLANNGKLLEDEYKLHDVPDIKGKRVLIVDDLVSRGGTAYLAARTLKENGANKVGLCVAHCENGIFSGKLLEPEENGEYTVDKVYTAGTTPLDARHENLIIIK